MLSLRKVCERLFPKPPKDSWPEHFRKRAEAIAEIRGTDGYAAILDIIEMEAAQHYHRITKASTQERAWEAVRDLKVTERIGYLISRDVDIKLDALSRDRYEGVSGEIRDAAKEAARLQQAHLLGHQMHHQKNGA